MIPSIDRMNRMYTLRDTSDGDANKRVETEWDKQEKRLQEGAQKVFAHLQGKEEEVFKKLEQVIEQLEGKDREILGEMLRKRDFLQDLVATGKEQQSRLISSRQSLKEFLERKQSDYKGACAQLGSLKTSVKEIENQRTKTEIFLEEFGTRASKQIAGIPAQERSKLK